MKEKTLGDMVCATYFICITMKAGTGRTSCSMPQIFRLLAILLAIVSFFLLSMLSSNDSWKINIHRGLRVDKGRFSKSRLRSKLLVNKEDEDLPEETFGKPIFGSDFIVFYNAIPKTGSRSLDSAILQNIATRTHRPLHFQLIPALAFENETLLKQFVALQKVPSFVRGHAMFSEFDSPSKVVYINVVRDPVERVISNYYFDLFGDDEAKATHAEENWPDTIDECIKLTSNKCYEAVRYYQAVTLRQFCGMDEKCGTVNRWTLQKAKKNAKRYTVIGLTSELGNTLKVIGMLMPDTFGGIYHQYILHQNVTKTLTKTNVKHKPKPETVKILRQQMLLQYEFYDFISRRFETLKTDLRLE